MITLNEVMEINNMEEVYDIQQAFLDSPEGRDAFLQWVEKSAKEGNLQINRDGDYIIRRGWICVSK